MRFFDSTLIVAVTQSIGLVIAFGVSVMVSRTLGAEGKGTFSLLMSMATILYGVSNLGLGFASQYFISKKPGSFRTQFANILLFPLILSAVIVMVFLATFSLWQPLLRGLTLRSATPPLIMLPLMLFFEPCCQLLVVVGRIGLRSAAILVQTGVVLVSAALLLLAGATASSVSYCYAFGWLAGGVVALVSVVRAAGAPRSPSLRILGETLRYSVWIYLANLLKEIFLKVDFLFIYTTRSAGEAGVYSVAAALTSGMTTIMLAVQTIFYPSTSSKTDAEANESTPFFYRQVLLAMALAGLLMAALAYPLLLMFGPAFVSGTVPMLILIIATTIKGLNSILYLHILGRGKAYVMTITTTFTLLLSALFNSIFAPAYGMIGAATATLIAFVGENIVITLLYHVLTGGNVGALYAFSRNDFRVLPREVRSVVVRLRDQFIGNGSRD